MREENQYLRDPVTVEITHLDVAQFSARQCICQAAGQPGSSQLPAPGLDHRYRTTTTRSDDQQLLQLVIVQVGSKQLRVSAEPVPVLEQEGADNESGVSGTA